MDYTYCLTVKRTLGAYLNPKVEQRGKYTTINFETRWKRAVGRKPESKTYCIKIINKYQIYKVT